MKMKKFIMMMALLLSFAFSVHAQTALESQKVMDNVYVSVEAGALTPLDFNSMFPVNAEAGLKLGKEFTPVFGVEVEDFVTFGDNHFMDGKNFVKINNLLLNGKFNLNNLFSGYKGTPRKFEVSTVTGLGWQHRYGIISKDDDEIVAKTGLDLAVNLNEANALVLTPAVYWNMTNGRGDAIHFNKNHAQLGIGLSYVHHFITSNGTHTFKMYDIDNYKRTIDNLNEMLSRKPREVIKEVVKEKFVPVENVVWIPFAFNKAELTDESKALLDNIKDVKGVNIDGYASWEDGSNAEHNMNLSVSRAEAVASYLNDLGVKVNATEGHGAQNVTSQRCVIITIVK